MVLIFSNSEKLALNSQLCKYLVFTAINLFIFPNFFYSPYTDKKENQIFLIYKEIQYGAVAKSDMTNGLLIYGEIFALFLIYDFATAPL